MREGEGDELLRVEASGYLAGFLDDARTDVDDSRLTPSPGNGSEELH